MHGATGGRGSNPLACGWCFVFCVSLDHIGLNPVGLRLVWKLEHIGSNPVALVDIL